MTSTFSQESDADTSHVEDRWLAFDKLQHVTFSSLWVLSTQYVAVNKLGFSEGEAFPVSVTTGVLIGLVKELTDARKPKGYVSKRDLAANGLGLVLGSAVVLTRGPGP